MSLKDWLQQSPLVAGAALGGGLLGGLFNLARKALWRVRAAKTRPALRVVEAGLVFSLTVCAMYVAAATAGRSELLCRWSLSPTGD